MRILIALCVFFMWVSPALAQTTPVPTPTPLPLPQQDMAEAIATANSSITTLPGNLGVPDGVPALPEDNSQVIFGYVKWLISPTAAEEYAGPFAPMIQHIGLGLGILFTFFGIYTTVYVIANLRGWVAALFELARRIKDLILQMAQAWPVVLVAGVVIFIAIKLYGEEGVRTWIAENLARVMTWVSEIAEDLIGRI